MIDTLEFYEELKKNLEPEAARSIAELLGKLYRELSNTVTKVEFERLTGIVTELAKSQKELAEAQKRTEEELRTLVSEHKKTRDILAGLSDLVGYSLEDKIFPYMEEFVRQEYGLEIVVLDRRNVVYPDGRFDEVNIYVEGRRNGEKVYLAGECKSRPGKKDIKKFSEMLKRLSRSLGGDVKGFIVGFYYSPEVEDYLREKHPEIKALKSFEFEMKYAKRT